MRPNTAAPILPVPLRSSRGCTVGGPLGLTVVERSRAASHPVSRSDAAIRSSPGSARLLSVDMSGSAVDRVESAQSPSCCTRLSIAVRAFQAVSTGLVGASLKYDKKEGSHRRLRPGRVAVGPRQTSVRVGDHGCCRSIGHWRRVRRQRLDRPFGSVGPIALGYRLRGDRLRSFPLGTAHQVKLARSVAQEPFLVRSPGVGASRRTREARWWPGLACRPTQKFGRSFEPVQLGQCSSLSHGCRDTRALIGGPAGNRHSPLSR